MSKYRKKAHLTATMHMWNKFYKDIAKDVINKKWKSKAVWGGIKDGMIKLAPINKAVSKKVIKLVKKVETMIAKDKFHPFTGLIKNQEGKLIAKKGQVLTDNDLLGMNYYVNGIIGKLPK